MATLYLIRHAQASFGMENYDLLSEKGRKQSAFLTGYFEQVVPNGIEALYTGEMERQKETAAIGLPGLSSTIIPGLNEYDHVNLLNVYRPEWVEREKIIAYLAAHTDPKKAMQHEFERGMQKWIEETDHPGYTEPWPAFQERCVSALQQVLDNSREAGQKQVAVVTSGGYISAVVGHVLGLSPKKIMDINWVIANTAITGLLFNDEKVSLSFLNNYQHLPNGMVTFR